MDFNLMATQKSKLCDISISRCSDSVRIAGNWKIFEGETTEIWFEIHGPQEDLERIQPHGSAFLVALVVPAMERGVDIHVEYPVPAELLFNSNENLIPLLSTMLPGLERITVTAEAGPVNFPDKRRKGASTGMSCGLDSFTTLIRSRGDDVPGTQKIARLVFHDVGASGKDGQSTGLFDKRFSRAKAVAKSEALPIIKVLANLSNIYKTGFMKTHTLRNAAAAMSLQDIVGCYLYSSGFSYEGVHGGQTSDCATADPILLPILSTSSFKLASSGSGMSRMEKTLTYMASPVHLSGLDICTSTAVGSHQNCGKCFKCARFLLIAQARGELELYRRVFDLDSFRNHQWKISKRLVKLAKRKNCSRPDSHVLEYLRENKTRAPFSAQLVGKAAAILSYLK